MRFLLAILLFLISTQGKAEMNIIDHIITKPTLQALIDAVGNYNPDGRGKLYWPAYIDEDGNYVGATWRGDIAFAVGVTDVTDPANPVPVDGYFVWVGLLTRNSTLEAISILLGDRDSKTTLINNVPTGKIYALSPISAGSNYNWSTGITGQ